MQMEVKKKEEKEKEEKKENSILNDKNEAS